MLNVMHFAFVPFGERAPEAAVACDGLVPGARLDLSHWSGNETPAHLKGDTSVEIALSFASERTTHDVEVVTNNHFDADGVLACWCALRPELALEHRSALICAAECGDFAAWPSDPRGAWLEASIDVLSAGLADEAAYRRILPELDDLVPNIAAHEDLWAKPYRALLDAERSIESGAVSVAREGRIAVFSHAPRAAELPGAWISRLQQDGTDRLLLAFADLDGGFQYRYLLPLWAWADTVQRPKIPMPRRGRIRHALGPEWIVKGRRGMTGVTYTGTPIRTPPDEIARTLASIDTDGRG